MTTYTIRYALYDQAYDVGSGYYWTWKEADLSKELLIRFYKSISNVVPTNANAIKPDDTRCGYKEFEGEHVIYRFYNGGSDRVGRPNRCVILTAWLKRIEGQTGGAPALSEDEVNKILQLPTFKKLEKTAFAQVIPIPTPWILSEQFPSEAEALKGKYDLLVKEKAESDNRLHHEIQELQQTNKELEAKKKEGESEIDGLQSKNSSLEKDNDRLKNKIDKLNDEIASLRYSHAAPPATQHTLAPQAQFSTANACVTHCKFIGWIPPIQKPVENLKFVDVSYEIEIYDANASFRELLYTLKVSAPDEYGNATLEKEISAESLMERKIEIQLFERIPQYNFDKPVKVRKKLFGFIPWGYDEDSEHATSQEKKQVLLMLGEPIFK